jgi:hypothetical protein
MPYKISFTSGSDVPESRSGDLALHAYAGFRLLPFSIIADATQDRGPWGRLEEAE